VILPGGWVFGRNDRIDEERARIHLYSRGENCHCSFRSRDLSTVKTL